MPLFSPKCFFLFLLCCFPQNHYVKPLIVFPQENRATDWTDCQSVSCPCESQRNWHCRLRATVPWHCKCVLSFSEISEIQPRRQKWKQFKLFPVENTCLDLAESSLLKKLIGLPNTQFSVCHQCCLEQVKQTGTLGDLIFQGVSVD